MIHELKIKENYLHNLMIGIKKVEIRYNDRDYQAGDILSFWNRQEHGLPKKVHFRITHIHYGLGLEKGFIALSVELQPKERDYGSGT